MAWCSSSMGPLRYSSQNQRPTLHPHLITGRQPVIDKLDAVDMVLGRLPVRDAGIVLWRLQKLASGNGIMLLKVSGMAEFSSLREYRKLFGHASGNESSRTQGPKVGLVVVCRYLSVVFRPTHV